jgi:hypothetical protein
MPVTMAAKDTVRLVVEVTEENRAALRMEAVIRGVDMGDIINEWVAEHLSEHLEKIRERRNPPDPGPKSRKS